MKIVLYGKQGHAYTVAFKNFLNSTDIPYVYKDISKDVEAREHSKELYDGVAKFPTLFVDVFIRIVSPSSSPNVIP